MAQPIKRFKEQQESKTLQFQTSYGITGAVLELRMEHLLYFKNLLIRTNNFIESRDNIQNGEEMIDLANKALDIIPRLKPFLDLFQDIVHPDEYDIWTK